jgi:ATP-binding cassette, subfamily B, bacterial
MTSSAEAGRDDLPPALSSMWRLCRLGFRHEPRLMTAAVALGLLAALPDAVVALWLKLLADGIATPDHRPVYLAATGLAVSAVGTWFLRVVADRTQNRFRDRVQVALEAHVARLQASVATIAHHERPDYLDRLSVLRNQTFVLDHMYLSVFSTLGWILRLAALAALLATVSPLLLLLLVFAVPTLAASTWRPAVERAAEERGAAAGRLARHLFLTATTAAPGKEVRVLGLGDRLVAARREAWERWYAPIARARVGSAWWNTIGWVVFAIGYVGAIVFVSSGLRAPAGSVLLVLAAGAQLSWYVSGTVSEIGFLRGIWMDGARRLAWLEDYAASFRAHSDAPVPHALRDGISLHDVWFTYPGAPWPALRDVSVRLPAGAVVAIVGENGAGKSTLVKLLCKLYEPDAGRIEADGVDLARMPTDQWRTRASGAYQDFFRFEFRAQQTVGLGDVPRLDDEPAVASAVDNAGADDVVATLPDGLATQLGRAWPDGVDVSFGQWQKLALARGFMRDEPLLLVLDEPTAALDAETEHALFERYASGARRLTERGGIVVLVSHRFSTVRMADLIIVMDGARVVESGSHDELMALGSQYASLYEMQAAAYR